MIVTERFVFLHLHKSGGTFVNECLLKFVPGATSLGHHVPHSLLPREHAGKPVIGVVRNPWSYYVSWYAFQSAKKRSNLLFDVLSEGNRLSFEDTIRNMCSLKEGGQQFKALLNLLPQTYNNRGLNLPSEVLASIVHSTLGFYSHLYRHMYGDPVAITRIIRMETLRQDLLSALEEVGCAVPADMREFITDAAPRNVSAHGDYTNYYSESLRQLIANSDASLIRIHNYRFGG